MRKYTNKTKVTEVTDTHIICDFCKKELVDVYGAITVNFPYGHCLDTVDYGSEFCSDSCVINFFNRHIEENGHQQLPVKEKNQVSRQLEAMRKVAKKYSKVLKRLAEYDENGVE